TGSAPAANVEAVVSDITAEMKGMIVTDAEARAAVAQLKGLAPKDAKAALAALQQRGALDTLAAEVPDDARSELMNVMIRAGMIGSEHGSVSAPGRTGPTPPQPPVFGAHNADLSPAVSAMVREENLDRLSTF